MLHDRLLNLIVLVLKINKIIKINKKRKQKSGILRKEYKLYHSLFEFRLCKTNNYTNYKDYKRDSILVIYRN